MTSGNYFMPKIIKWSPQNKDAFKIIDFNVCMSDRQIIKIQVIWLYNNSR